MKRKVKVKYLDINTLPNEEKNRLDYLLSIKKYYFIDELQSYMQNIYTEKNLINQFILKNTKQITELVHKTALEEFLDVNYIFSKAITENKFDKKTFCAKLVVSKY